MRDVSDGPPPGELFDLLSDEYARDILAATSVRPMSASELADKCEMSEPTVYRRVAWLQDHDLLEERTKVETDGNNYNVFAATLAGLTVELDDGTFEAAIQRTEPEAFPGQGADDTADRFKEMWENL